MLSILYVYDTLFHHGFVKNGFLFSCWMGVRLCPFWRQMGEKCANNFQKGQQLRSNSSFIVGCFGLWVNKILLKVAKLPLKGAQNKAII